MIIGWNVPWTRKPATERNNRLDVNLVKISIPILTKSMTRGRIKRRSSPHAESPDTKFNCTIQPCLYYASIALSAFLCYALRDEGIQESGNMLHNSLNNFLYIIYVAVTFLNMFRNIPSQGSVDKRLATCAAETSKPSWSSSASSEISLASNPDDTRKQNKEFNLKF